MKQEIALKVANQIVYDLNERLGGTLPLEERKTLVVCWAHIIMDTIRQEALKGAQDAIAY